ncbi:MAG: DUF2795 domain-containing protein [Candidatus Xenobia bacterium]
MREQSYSVNDIREIMQRVGSWASSWDDVLAWLKVEGFEQPFLSHRRDLPALFDGFSELKIQGVPYSSDYRQVWHDLTGQPAEAQPAVEPSRAADKLLAELRGRWLAGLEFPCSHGDIVRQAHRNDTPASIGQYFQQLPERRYDSWENILGELAALPRP